MVKKFEPISVELTSADKNTLKDIDHSLNEILNDIEQIGVRLVPNGTGGKQPVVYMCSDSQVLFDKIQGEIEEFQARLRNLVEESIDHTEVATQTV